MAACAKVESPCNVMCVVALVLSPVARERISYFSPHFLWMGSFFRELLIKKTQLSNHQILGNLSVMKKYMSIRNYLFHCLILLLILLQFFAHAPVSS